jgi:hypothetical protein
MADGSEWFWLGKMSKKKLDLLTQIADLMSDQECEKHTLTVTTQADRSPEYYTTVGVICPIHNKLVNFRLPVN